MPDEAWWECRDRELTQEGDGDCSLEWGQIGNGYVMQDEWYGRKGRQ